MSGKELKNKLESCGYTQRFVASGLGITPQALVSIFRADDVRSGTLERICKVLNVSMSFFYPENKVENNNVNDFRKSEIHNQHLGSGNITENATVDRLVEMNLALIQMLQDKKKEE